MNQHEKGIAFGWRRTVLYPVHGKLHGKFGRKFSEVAVVVLIGLVTFGTGNFPRCKPDEGNRVFRVFSRPEWNHVLTENYSVIAFPVFALDAIISLYGVYGFARPGFEDAQ